MVINIGPMELEFEIEDLEKTNASVVVYWYDQEFYEGYGFAAWELNGKFGYHALGHCSCYGPTDHLDPRVLWTAEEMETVVSNSDYDYDHAPEVWSKLKEVLGNYETYSI
jgi:hypothetical protein